MKKIIKSARFILVLLTGIMMACTQGKTDENTALGKLDISPKMETYRPFKNYLADSSTIANAKLKIYFSVDFSCPSCIAKVDQWQSLVKNELPKSVPVILICHAVDNFRYMKYICESGTVKEFQYPFFLDLDNEFTKNLEIARTGGTEAILADQQNNVLVIGDLLSSKEVKASFLAKINSYNKN